MEFLKYIARKCIGKIYCAGIHIQSLYLVLRQQLHPPAVLRYYIWEYSSVQIISVRLEGVSG